MTQGGLDIAAHKRALTQILTSIVKEVGEKLVFKGGTCAFLFYDLPRFSLDLDFDLLASLSEKETDKLGVMLRKYGEVKDFSEKRFTTFFLVSYEKGAANIKVEMNKRRWYNATYNTIWFMGVKMKIADEETAFSQKIVALTDRRQPVSRDLFDVHYFLKMGYPLNREMIEERTDGSLGDYLEKCISFINGHYTRKNVLYGLGELLGDEQKIWAKESLKEETISLLEERIQRVK